MVKGDGLNGAVKVFVGFEHGALCFPESADVTARHLG